MPLSTHPMAQPAPSPSPAASSHPQRHVQRARVEVLLRQRRAGGQDAGGAQGSDAVEDDFLHQQAHLAVGLGTCAAYCL